MTKQGTDLIALAEHDFDFFEDDDCWNCGGEGWVADCFDGFCINAEDGCELCMTRCDICRPRAIASHKENSR